MLHQNRISTDNTKVVVGHVMGARPRESILNYPAVLPRMENSDLSSHTFPLVLAHVGKTEGNTAVSVPEALGQYLLVELVSSGEVSYILNGKKYQVGPQEVFVSHTNEKYSVTESEDKNQIRHYMLLCGAALHQLVLQLNLSGCYACRLKGEDVKRVLEIMHEASAVMLQSIDSAEISHLSILAYEVLLLLAQNNTHKQLPQEISAVMHFMHANVHKPLTINQIADTAGISISYLHRLFNKYLATSPIHYFIDLKMKHIEREITHSTVPINQIASNYGFSDLSYFSNIFKKNFQVSPRNYRKMANSRL